MIISKKALAKPPSPNSEAVADVEVMNYLRRMGNLDEIKIVKNAMHAISLAKYPEAIKDITSCLGISWETLFRLRYCKTYVRPYLNYRYKNTILSSCSEQKLTTSRAKSEALNLEKEEASTNEAQDTSNKKFCTNLCMRFEPQIKQNFHKKFTGAIGSSLMRDDSGLGKKEQDTSNASDLPEAKRATALTQ